MPLQTDDQVRDAKAINQGSGRLARRENKLDLDSIDNVDRILRVCGTINWPTAKKRETAACPVLLVLLHSSATSHTRATSLPTIESGEGSSAAVFCYQNTGLN